MKKRNWLLLAAALCAAPLSMAQTGNAKPVRIIVTFAAGGPVDFVARTIAGPMGRALERTVIVENKPGANGAIGASDVMRAEPDGNTLWLTSVGAAAINQSLYDKLPYDMQRDFSPVSLVVDNNEVFVVKAENPAQDATDLIARAKRGKEPLPIGSSGTGSIPHLALAQLESATGAQLLHVPYNGMAPALNDLMGGQVQGVFADVPAVMGHLKGGRLKALGMASQRRHPGLPEVKTFEEQGIRGMDTNNWYGLFVSAKTPAEVIDTLNKAVRQAVADPATHKRLADSGAEPKASTPQELSALLKADTQKWAQLIKARHIKVSQ
ncbi:MAG: tripartite tricarboxylate transporter substrate binding protein [Ottowia sp.]|uniref:Bug family tripartite tricarboxylate transporter substrate binding protein n=1 Tax=Ottowia sp. TaxID=1898956 RepID=UPI003C795069